MLYGHSGVGKTESAKSVSKSLGGNLLRIQFSMMQTQEAFDYVFGAEHSRNSLARDLSNFNKLVSKCTDNAENKV